MQEININLTAKQSLALKYLFAEDTKEVLFGGAKGGAKSAFLCFFSMLYADWVAKVCKIDLQTPPEYPYLIGFLGRQRAVDFNDTTFETFKKLVPSRTYEIRTQDKEIIFFRSLKYQYGGLDDEKTVNKFNSAEYGLVAIDQAEEIERDSMAMLQGTLYRATINGIALPYRCLWTANPAECALKEDFIKNKTSGYIYVPALPSDNEFIDSEKYIAQLKHSWRHRPEMIRAYVEGNWDAIQGEGFLLTRADCEKAHTARKLTSQLTRTWVSIDPAWLGKDTDEIVRYVMRNNEIIVSEFDIAKSTTEQGAECVKLSNNHSCSTILVDTIGIGAGVFDKCNELKPMSDVISINSSCKAGELEKNDNIAQQQSRKYYNLRAEMWWEASEAVKNGEFVVPKDEKLVSQLCSVKYEIKNGRIKIEDKKEIKQRIGESPNRADAFIMGVWARNKVKLDCEMHREENEGFNINYGQRRRGY